MSDVEVDASLGEVASELVSQSGPPAEGTFTYVDIGSLDKESKTIGETKEIPVSDAPSRAKQLLRKGDVLVSMTRPNLNAVAIVPPQLDGAIGSTGFHVLRTRWMEPEFLHYLVQTSEFVEAMVSVVQGALYPAIRPTDIKNFQFRLPPRAEQARIVEKLESLLADLDAGVAELKAAQRKLVQYRQSLLKAAMDGALTAGWRAAHTPEGRSSTAEGWSSGEHLLQRILQERRARFVQKHGSKKKYREPVAPDVSQLPELPDGWVWASVEQLAELVSGHTPKDAGQFAADDAEVHWFKVGDMNTEGNEQILVAASTRFLRETADELGLKAMPVGTIVFPKRGGAIATNKKRRLGVEGAYDLNMMGLVPVPIAADWLWSWFTGIDLAKLADGSNVPQINNPDIAPLCVPLPPLEEQHAILAHLDADLAACKQQEQAIAHGLKLAAAQRRNLLRAAFAGQLVPQDPNDEPASALLERIRAEKAGNAGGRGTKKNGKRTNSPA